MKGRRWNKMEIMGALPAGEKESARVMTHILGIMGKDVSGALQVSLNSLSPLHHSVVTKHPYADTSDEWLIQTTVIVDTKVLRKVSKEEKEESA